MTSSKQPLITDPKTKKKTPPPTVSAQEKAHAVLAVWTERCKPVEVCRHFKINWMTFNQWQRRAMEGMLQALESRVNLAKGEALSPRLQALLQRQQCHLQPTKLTQRLEQFQQNKVAHPSVVPAKPE